MRDEICPLFNHGLGENTCIGGRYIVMESLVDVPMNGRYGTLCALEHLIITRQRTVIIRKGGETTYHARTHTLYPAKRTRHAKHARKFLIRLQCRRLYRTLRPSIYPSSCIGHTRQ